MQKVPTESVEQQKFIQWLKVKKIFHFATNNENNTYKQDRKYAMIAESKAKSMGKLKGVSDLTIFLPNKIIFIEMKRQGTTLKSGKISHSNSKVSDEQKAFIDKVNTYSYSAAFVAYGFNEAVKIVEQELQVI